jgi:Xaa-Pro dipeptidase
MPNRINGLKDKIVENQLETYIISMPPNIRYYTGSIGGSYLLVSPEEEPLLLVSALDENVTRDQAQYCIVETYTSYGLITRLAEILRSIHSRNIGFDGLPLKFLDSLGKRIPEAVFKQNQEVIWEQRKVKDSAEIRLMTEAGKLADHAMEALSEELRIGVTEYQLAAKASFVMMREGAEAHAFEFTVGSGPRSAYPHASVTDRKIARGDLIVVDIGALHKGYCSDLTRTFIAGRPDEKKMKIYEIVHRSHDAAYDKMIMGASCKDVDSVSRRIIEKVGYGAYYIHSLGHGVGLEIHEPPSVSQRSLEKLEAGNVVSDEPGVYIHGEGGVRIEDTVLITVGGPKRLTNFPRELKEVVF